MPILLLHEPLHGCALLCCGYEAHVGMVGRQADGAGEVEIDLGLMLEVIRRT